MLSEQQQTWESKAEAFARTRENIIKILEEAKHSVHMAYIYTMFMYKFNYLPDLERRMRELVESGDVEKHPRPIPTYELRK